MDRIVREMQAHPGPQLARLEEFSERYPWFFKEMPHLAAMASQDDMNMDMFAFMMGKIRAGGGSKAEEEVGEALAKDYITDIASE